MRYFGKRSFSSVLKVFINIFYYLQIVHGVVVGAELVYAALKGRLEAKNWPVTILDATHGLVEAVSENTRSLKLVVNTGELSFTGIASWEALLVGGMVFLLTWGTMFFITYQLKKMFGSFTEANLFVKANVVRVRHIGMALVLTSIVQRVFNFWYTSYLNSNFTLTNGSTFVGNDSADLIIFGALILVLSEVFREGVVLQEEKELTI